MLSLLKHLVGTASQNKVIDIECDKDHVLAITLHVDAVVGLALLER